MDPLLSNSVQYYCLKGEKKDTTLNWLPTIEEPRAMKRKDKPIDICIRETRWTEEKLKQFYSDLKAIRMNVKSVDVIPRLIKRDYEQPALSVTPRIWNSEQKERKESTTSIQKFVEDRAIQCPVKHISHKIIIFIRTYILKIFL